MATPMSRLSESSVDKEVSDEVEISSPSNQESGKKTCNTCVKSPRKRVILLCILVAILAAAVGALIGYFVPLALKSSCVKTSSASEDVLDKFADEVSTTELEENLRYM